MLESKGFLYGLPAITIGEGNNIFLTAIHQSDNALTNVMHTNG